MNNEGPDYPPTMDDLRKLAVLAIEVGITCKPAMAGEDGCSYVDNDTIDRIRDRMKRMGIDWQALADKVKV